MPLRIHRMICLLHAAALFLLWAVLLSRGYGIGSCVLSSSYFLLHWFMYALLMYCLKHHSYTILAGYDEHVAYKEGIVQKMVSAMLFLLGTTSLFFTILQLLVAISNQGWLFPYLFVAYIFEFCGTIVYVNVKYQKDLLVDQSLYPYQRSANKLTIAVLSSIACLTIALLIVFTIYSIPNNSPAAFQLSGVILLYLGVNLPWIIVESFRVQNVVENHILYQFHPFIRFLIPFNILMILWIFWIGHAS